MSVMYASVAELASFLKKDLDTSTATLDIQMASALFSVRAGTWWNHVSETYEVEAFGQRRHILPFRPIVSIDEVRVISAAGETTIITDYQLIRKTLYRLLGFGVPWRYPPDMLQVDVTHGLAAATDDVKGAILETAGAAYESPDVTVQAEAIDDYSYRSAPNSGGMMLTPSAATLADLYRGTFAA